MLRAILRLLKNPHASYSIIAESSHVAECAQFAVNVVVSRVIEITQGKNQL